MASLTHPSWQLWIDTGGTFTDCFAHSPDGKIQRLKILTSSVLRGTVLHNVDSHTLSVSLNWPLQEDIFKNFEVRTPGKTFRTKIESVDFKKNQIRLQAPLQKDLSGLPIEITSNEEAPVLAARMLTGTPLDRKFPLLEMKLGSTRGTNAILEKKGARTALLITKGFRDLVRIGNQQRKELFAIHVLKPDPLYALVMEIDERMDDRGNTRTLPDDEALDLIARELKKKKIESVAVACLNSYRNSAHEELVKKVLTKHAFHHLSLTSELSSQIRILPRTETAIANAYLAPIIDQYVFRIRQGLSGAKLSIMTSAGSLVSSGSFFPKDSLLSGPAGGVVGAAHKALQSGVHAIIAFDMGGTSTDVSLYNDRFDYRFESTVGDLKILSPSLMIETIAAGGGSICDFDGDRFTIGPESAGATPGPACYSAGGPLTITDVNILLGRLDPENFAIPIDRNKSVMAFNRLLQKVHGHSNGKIQPTAILESLLRIANEKMAEAIKKISIQRGHDPREFTLLSFGGAGGQHACALAELLGMKEVMVPYDAGLLSAFGIGHAAVERFEEKTVLKPWKSCSREIRNIEHQLFALARKKLAADELQEKLVIKKTLLFLRFQGQDSTLEIELRKPEDVLKDFRKKYLSVYGHWTDREVELESVRIIAATAKAESPQKFRAVRAYKPKEEKRGWIYADGKKKKGSIYRWENLSAGARIIGPALVVSDNSTTFIAVGWVWKLDASQNARISAQKIRIRKTGHPALAERELFTNRFTSIAQEMGALLQRSSFSVNIKERLDFSCAILDSNGCLVVNAPHIPVHLGSMGVCVREVRACIGMKEGDVVITNHPGFGGSHLPDVTLIKPVYYKKQLMGYVANRAHHAEIGGKKPGSMPSDAKALEQEGIIIKPMYLVRNGRARWDEITRLLSGGRWPTRALDENLADLNGALAAIQLGEKGLQDLCRQHGASKIAALMAGLRNHAARIMREKIKNLKQKTFYAVEKLDDGAVLKVRISKAGSRLKIDFTGSAKTHAGNLNATRAIVQSVVLYTLRLLVNQPLPMNEGLLQPVDLIIPRGLLNPDFSTAIPPAVVGGNTEVSQRLTDTLLKAFGLAACSQGTMNNFLFGTDRFGYYETICGGTGAGPGFDGTDAVHQHMTNTRITDPEIMELRYPISVERFEIRSGSGGKGRWNGGNGVEREILFRENVEVSLLTQHRKERPYGVKGGGAGKTGEQYLIRVNGDKEKLKGMDSREVRAGDRLIIKTPGGGAWGKEKSGH